MATDAYTLKQLVETIAPAADADETLRTIRQVRHWTASDLLEPIEGKSTGTGISRRYSADEVRKAAILHELAHYRVPVPVLEDSFPQAMVNYLPSSEWRAAVTGTRQVMLQLAYSAGSVQVQMIADPKTPNMLTARRLSQADPMMAPASAIVINLTRLFGRLRL